MHVASLRPLDLNIYGAYRTSLHLVLCHACACACEIQHVTNATSTVCVRPFCLLSILPSSHFHRHPCSPPPLSHITWQIYGLNHSYGILSPRTWTSLATSYSGFRLRRLLCRRTPCRHICAGVVHGFVPRYVCSLHRRQAERSWCPSSGGHPVCVGLRVAPLPCALPCVGNMG